MAAIISCHHQYSFSQLTTFQKYVSRQIPSKCINLSSLADASGQRFKPLCSDEKSTLFEHADPKRDVFSVMKKSAIPFALAIGLVTGFPDLGYLGQIHVGAAIAIPIAPGLPDVSVLISGPPIKDPGALLRYALPIDNKAIREVQKPLEDITESPKIAGLKALDSVERNVR